MSARSRETIIDTEDTRFGNTPGVHLLTAHSILEARFTLEDEDTIAALR